MNIRLERYPKDQPYSGKLRTWRMLAWTGKRWEQIGRLDYEFYLLIQMKKLLKAARFKQHGAKV